MVVWIIVGIAVVALAAFAFWPREKGIRDATVRSAQRRTQGEVEHGDNPFGPAGPL